MFPLQTLTNRRHTRKVGPRMSSGETRDPGPWTPKCLGGTWDSQSGTRDPKYLTETQDFQFSIVLIVYSALNTLDSTCYKTLHLSVHKINLFHGEYTEATIMTCYKFQKIRSSYINFSKIFEKKNCEGVPIYLVKFKILSLQLCKCTHFWLFLRCLLNVSEYLFWWLLCKHVNSKLCWSMGFF